MNKKHCFPSIICLFHIKPGHPRNGLLRVYIRGSRPRRGQTLWDLSWVTCWDLYPFLLYWHAHKPFQNEDAPCDFSCINHHKPIPRHSFRCPQTIPGRCRLFLHGGHNWSGHLGFSGKGMCVCVCVCVMVGYMDKSGIFLYINIYIYIYTADKTLENTITWLLIKYLKPCMPKICQDPPHIETMQVQASGRALLHVLH